MPANDSPLWPILRNLVVGLILLGFLHYNYNALDSRDLGTIIGVLTSLAGFDVAKRTLVKPSDPPSS
jgi:hypothetical protein